MQIQIHWSHLNWAIGTRESSWPRKSLLWDTIQHPTLVSWSLLSLDPLMWFHKDCIPYNLLAMEFPPKKIIAPAWHDPHQAAHLKYGMRPTIAQTNVHGPNGLISFIGIGLKWFPAWQLVSSPLDNSIDVKLRNRDKRWTSIVIKINSPKIVAQSSDKYLQTMSFGIAPDAMRWFLVLWFSETSGLPHECVKTPCTT